MESRNIRLAVIPGDGIGTEVVAEGLKVLEAVGTKIESHPLRPGRRPLAPTGETLPDAVLEELRGYDAILLGAVGDPSVPAGRPGARPAARASASSSTTTSTCARSSSSPAWRRPLADTRPEDIDMVVVREGTEGLYAGTGGVMRARHAPRDRDPGVRSTPRYGVERVVRYAFEQGDRRARARS